MKPRGKDKKPRKSRREKGVLWVAYENGLPVAVADSAIELSEIVGVNVNTIRSNSWKYQNGELKEAKFMKIKIDEGD